MIVVASEHLASWEKAVLLARFFTPQDTPAKSLGFSLIEVLVSLFLFSVLALSISAIMPISAMFQQADIGIIGDYAEVVPLLTTALKEAKKLL